MVFLIIILVTLLVCIIAFLMGGKEQDRRLIALGGLRKMYGPLIDTILSNPQSVLLKNTPSRLIIAGKLNNYDYMWQISTPDGKKITIRITVTCDSQILEREEFDFPISSQWQSEEIIDTLYSHIKYREVIGFK